MEPPEVLEVLVAVVATLGELVATVTAPCRSVWPVMYPMSLHNDLRRFTWTLRDTLAHPDFVYLGYRNVTSLYRRSVTDLGRALAALGDTQWVTWADVRATARGWREMVDGLAKSWFWVAEEAMELRDTWKNVATARARGLQDEPTDWGTAGDNLVAATQRPPETLTHKAQMAAATKAMEEAVVAISQARAATRRLRVEEVRGLLERLVAACDRATMFPRELQRRLGDIEATLKGTKEASRDVPKALVAAVAEVERLWEGIARLTMRHLLVTLGDIQHLLCSPYGSPGGPGGLGGRAVAVQCQKAIENIPRLLENNYVTTMTSSSGQ